jgi:hypothetical protein
MRALPFVAGAIVAIGLAFLGATYYVQSTCPSVSGCFGPAYPETGIVITLSGIAIFVIARFALRLGAAKP